MARLRLRDDKAVLVSRIDFMTYATVVVFFFLAASFWYVQVLHGDEYTNLSENNRLRALPLRAPRGMILDRHGRLLTQNNPSYNLLLARERTKDIGAALAYATAALALPPAEIRKRYDKSKHLKSFHPILLAEDLTLAQVAYFEAHSLERPEFSEHPEFSIEVSHKRFYREGSLAAHVLGYLGEVTSEQLARDKRYRLGDVIGQKGVEAEYDAQLRGEDGEQIVVVDNQGRITAEHKRDPPRMGENLYLTLDLDLQRIAEEFFATQAGTTGAGSCVAIDPRNGEILVMVSAPSFDPNLFAQRFSEEQWAEVSDDANHPLQNRAIQSAYSPGSVFKIFMALAALEEGYSPVATVQCSGGATFYNRYFRCWNRSGHGPMALRNAIKYSCDTYFYTLGRNLGIERIAKYATKMSLGGRTGIDLPSERAGLVPTPAWSEKDRHLPWYPGETISVAIGQGPLLTTPLQIAAATSVIATGGTLYQPHLAYRFEDPASGGRSTVKPTVSNRVSLPPAALALLRDGMWAVVNEGGTGTRGRAAGLDICGKTGTVQVIQGAGSRSERLPPSLRDHGWFTAFAPRDKPELVVAVFLENGNHGYYGATLAKQIFERHFEKLGVYTAPAPERQVRYPVVFPEGSGPLPAIVPPAPMTPLPATAARVE